MPPPSFSSTAGLGALNVPRSTVGLIKDAAQSMHTAVVKATKSSRDAAQNAIRAMLMDPIFEIEQHDDDMGSCAEIHVRISSNTVCAVIAEKLQTDLMNAWNQVKPRNQPLHRMAVVSMLESLKLLWNPTILYRDWSESVLVPCLQSIDTPESDKARIRNLLVYGMLVATKLAMENAHESENSNQPSSSATSLTYSLTDWVFGSYVELASHQAELMPLPEDAAQHSDQDHESHTESIANAAQHLEDSPELRSEFERIIAQFSALEPTRFFLALSNVLTGVSSEGPVLYLLASFLHAQSMHIYRITSTNLLPIVIEKLLHTYSTRSMALGIKCLAMVLPHVPQYIVKDSVGLQSIFAIYARGITWRGANDEDAMSACISLLFTLLYGMFPNNMILFVRAPVAYLGEDHRIDWDLAAMRASSLALLRNHAAHPLLAEMDAVTERTVFKRWAQQDAADVTAACMSLRIALREESVDVDRLFANHVPSNSTLLQVEHKFELYLKEQLLLHIGRLHRDRIGDAAAEAEHQSLYHNLRALRSQLQAAQARSDRQRAEAQAANLRHIAWENELNAKLNTYREERRSWTTEKQQLLKQLSDAHTTHHTQQAKITEMGSKLFQLEQDMMRAKPQLERIETYRANVQKLSNCMSDWEEDLEKYELQSREMDKMLSWWEGMELSVANSEANADRYRALLAERTTENTRLTAQLASLRTSTENQAKRLAANQTWLLEAVVGPETDRAEPSFNRPYPTSSQAMDEVRQANTRADRMERQVLDLHVQIEQLQNELRMRSVTDQVNNEKISWSPSLFSPNTLQSEQNLDEQESVPPLSLGSPKQRSSNIKK
ncbi:hypothetical protein MPSI1_003538 [Malassezia psittaci]|uniref:Uncharacterized protein n=1 Tax=Malassezia psittaci TaxID=1821823 RepID=A0AAF0FCJ9_9BASI|nr:hypothetical protein MPSI1_003538 [Malassezia psittaci]